MAPVPLARLTRARRVELLRGIYAIVNDPGPDPLEIAGAALDAGVTVVQYRAKGGMVPATLRELRLLTRRRGALLIVNDDARAALDFDCDGVHLGPGDSGFADVASVRETLGQRLIGLSCATVEETRSASASGADYLGLGAVYATASKADAGEPIGLEGLRARLAATSLPAAGIGGITLESLPAVARTGAAMAAVISALANAPNPNVAARALVEAWNAAIG